MFPEYQYDESADKNRSAKEQQEMNSLIKEIEGSALIEIGSTRLILVGKRARHPQNELTAATAIAI